MNMSHKWTFSLASIFLLLAFAVVPAMAQTIKAEWTDDLDGAGSGTDPGWKVTVGGLSDNGDQANDSVALTFLDTAGTAAADGTNVTNGTLADAKTEVESTIVVAAGLTIAVQVAVTTPDATITYQRVTFPESGEDATLAVTNLKLLPKLKKLTTPIYYVTFAGNTATVMFDFEAAKANTNDLPSAPLHISDVTLDSTNAAVLQRVSVIGTNMVMVRSIAASNIPSGLTTVSLNASYAIDDTTEPVGQAMVHYDNTAPLAAIPTTNPVTAVAASGAFQVPTIDENTQWNEDFYLKVTVIDDPANNGANDSNTNGSGPVLTMDNISVDGTKLTVVQLGVNAMQSATAADDADLNMDETDYLIHLRPVAGRATTAGEEVTITITPVDKAGNTGTPVEHKVKLAASTPPPAQFVRAIPASGNVSRSQLITVTFDKDPGTVTATNNVIVGGTGSRRVLSVPASQAAGALQITLTWTGGQQVLNYTVVVPAPPPAAAVAFTSAAPASGEVMAGSAITLTFAADPGTVTSNLAGAVITGTGVTRTLTIPANHAGGQVTIIIGWVKANHRTGSQTLTYTVTRPFVSANPTLPLNISDPIEIRANSFVVLVRNMSDHDFPNVPPVGGKPVDVKVWEGMPDLRDLFLRSAQSPGGALVLRRSADARDNDNAAGDGTYATPVHGSVGISEIMWGRDLGALTPSAQAASQWIELQNLNDKAVKVLIYAQKGSDGLISGGQLVNTAAGDNLLGHLLDGLVVDAIQNIRNNGDTAGGGWDVKGKEGNSVTGADFASMHRILPHGKSEFRNENGYRYTDRRGTHVNHWAESGSTYLRAKTETQPPILYDLKGTPGDVNARAGISILTPQGRSFRPASNNIIINEVGNSSNDDYDWLELRNVTGGNINLKNYLITMVRDSNTEHVLVRFPANDKAQVPAGGVFLLLKTDPAGDINHPIAATGRNVDLGAEYQQPGTPNSPVRYKVFGSLNLPNDDGQKFVLFVRRPDSGHDNGPGAHRDQGTSELGQADLDKIVDIAGFDDNLGKSGYPNSVSSTSLWPLYAFAGPRSNKNTFVNDRVFERHSGRLATKHDLAGAGIEGDDGNKPAFVHRPWTGVGYRRKADQNNANGGTPGYPNDASHSHGGTITSAVYISEIMYADDARGFLPQWIEIRNPHASLGANLHNWRLVITNHDDMNAAGDRFAGRGSASVLLRNMEIKPNSAVLIASRLAPRERHNLPDGDIFVIFPRYKGDLGMANANSDIFNTYGFKIELYANAHGGNTAHWQIVDTVGNLAARRTAGRNERTDTERFDDPAWMWPHALTESRARISVTRTNSKFDHGDQTTANPQSILTALSDGTKRASWILSNMDMRTGQIRSTYYGNEFDYSTPGQTLGQPLPVELSYFRPTLEDGKVTIKWTTESELDNAGFNILRSELRDGEFTQVNEQMIQGKGTTAERSNYKWVDTTAKPGVVYYYQIEDVSFAGEHTKLATTKLKGLISAKGKLTTQWGYLKNLR